MLEFLPAAAWTGVVPACGPGCGTRCNHVTGLLPNLLSVLGAENTSGRTRQAMPERELSAAWQWAHLHSMANGANPRHGAPAQELAVAMEHHQAGRLDRAEAIYRKVLQKNPGNVDALHLLGLAAFNRGHLERAIQLIGRALAAAPNLAPAHINLGNAQRAAGRLAEAVASYRRAIALKPDLWDAHSNLALVLCEQGNPAAALTHAERAVQQNPRHPDVLN